ncbi:hypothetical protein HETIRDRAFT_456377 [Heterobasidion irregulare TC 32-1]|uniref:Uncharacterized protein n=1 Tax=Heterobasidion irregulare (strain TC 32-1) TaxID=747525 RepID=W4JMV1_HETIT|nr:uncharacterized protein HETIRDRAFT_456377 [Heterobasidion irregulare TC 32-1]ETW74858.1 hypothetical protein HETIRDRAFT_456377 [Heterobasidion irregulare TC 32-1]
MTILLRIASAVPTLPESSSPPLSSTATSRLRLRPRSHRPPARIPGPLALTLTLTHNPQPTACSPALCFQGRPTSDTDPRTSDFRLPYHGVRQMPATPDVARHGPPLSRAHASAQFHAYLILGRGMTPSRVACQSRARYGFRSSKLCSHGGDAVRRGGGGGGGTLLSLSSSAASARIGHARVLHSAFCVLPATQEPTHALPPLNPSQPRTPARPTARPQGRGSWDKLLFLADAQRPPALA